MFTSALDEQFGEILKRISPAERRKFSRQVAIALRAHRSDEILANRDADGRAMVPRKSQKGHRRKKGKMFQKLGRRRAMRIRANSAYASISFQPKNRRIADNHHFGRVVQVNAYSRVRYPERTLLALNEPEEKIIKEHLYNLMAEAL